MVWLMILNWPYVWGWMLLCICWACNRLATRPGCILTLTLWDLGTLNWIRLLRFAIVCYVSISAYDSFDLDVSCTQLRHKQRFGYLAPSSSSNCICRRQGYLHVSPSGEVDEGEPFYMYRKGNEWVTVRVFCFCFFFLKKVHLWPTYLVG